MRRGRRCLLQSDLPSGRRRSKKDCTTYLDQFVRRLKGIEDTRFYRWQCLKYKMMLKWPDVLNLAKSGNPAPDRKVVKTDAEWREQLSDEEYHVTRQAGTERAFSSEMCSLFEPGIYSCLCCESVLFDASEKFESHTGWPSFTQSIKENVLAYRFDGPAFLKRVETICNSCGAHLGHVFPDGPAPSGLRYCMNAVALQKFGVVRPDADA